MTNSNGMLLRSSDGTHRLFKGWVDYAARKSEPFEGTKKKVWRSLKPRGVAVRPESLCSLGYFEKNSATLSALLSKDNDKNPLIVWSLGAREYMELPAYLKRRAERKALKLAAVS